MAVYAGGSVVGGCGDLGSGCFVGAPMTYHRQLAGMTDAALSIADWVHISERQGGRCFYCRRKLRKAVHDHLIPRNAGGSHTIENRVAACQPCDLAKGGRMPTADELSRQAAFITQNNAAAPHKKDGG